MENPILYNFHLSDRKEASDWSLYTNVIRPFMFRFDPETAHHLILLLMRVTGAVRPVDWVTRRVFNAGTTCKPVKAFGLTFANPVGLAAGYDKDGIAWRGLAALGFGHVEVGTVTPLPQPGNPGKRVFRLPEDLAVINRMGFPSQGAEAMVRRLESKRPGNLVLGVNIGKNKDTPNEEASLEYIQLLRTFAPLADYVAINVSSPNTPMLRMLQNRPALEALLKEVVKERDVISAESGRYVPLLVKLSPDVPFAMLGIIIEAIIRSKIEGVITSNTSTGIDRTDLVSSKACEEGGVSGMPLAEKALSVLRFTARELQGRLPIIASGGIISPHDAQVRLNAGATLVQLYTGLIYSGPSLVKNILLNLRYL